MTRRVAIGPVDQIPSDRCIAVGDGIAIALRVADEICAYRNRCLHQDSPLAGGIVRDGVLTCPLHFWRYEVISGRVTTGRAALEAFPVEIADGEAVVLLPDEQPRRSLRDELLERARSYDRTTQFEQERLDGAPDPTDEPVADGAAPTRIVDSGEVRPSS